VIGNNILINLGDEQVLLPFVDNQPDFRFISDPILTKLKTAWEDFLKSGNTLEVVDFSKDSNSDWAGFNKTILMSTNWRTWEINNDLRNAMIAAAIGRNADSFQSAYDIAKEWNPPSEYAINEWAEISKQFNIPIKF
jgi:hypothetical protein